MCWFLACQYDGRVLSGSLGAKERLGAEDARNQESSPRRHATIDRTVDAGLPVSSAA